MSRHLSGLSPARSDQLRISVIVTAVFGIVTGGVGCGGLRGL
jgi:hypothetical protein